MTDKRLKLFPSAAVAKVKKSHPEKFSQRISTMVGRYQGLLKCHQARLELSDTERHQVAECLNGSVVDGLFIDCLDQELSEAGCEELSIKISQASYADRLLLVESLDCDLALG